MSEYALVREAACVIIQVDMPFPSAAIVGCGVMTGYGSVVNAAKVKAGSSVVVLGTGGVGLNVIQGARIAGAGKIIAVDMNPGRLEMMDGGLTMPLSVRPFPLWEPLPDSPATLHQRRFIAGTRTYALTDLPQAFADMHAGRNAKGVILF